MGVWTFKKVYWALYEGLLFEDKAGFTQEACDVYGGIWIVDSVKACIEMLVDLTDNYKV